MTLNEARLRVKKYEEKLAEIGKDLGEAAGVNSDWHDNFSYDEAVRKFELNQILLDDAKKVLNDLLKNENNKT